MLSRRLLTGFADDLQAAWHRHMGPTPVNSFAEKPGSFPNLRSLLRRPPKVEQGGRNLLAKVRRPISGNTVLVRRREGVKQHHDRRLLALSFQLLGNFESHHAATRIA